LTLQGLPFQQAHHATLFMNDPGNAQPPAAGWLFPHEWQEPMNGDFDADECDSEEEEEE